MIEFSKKMSNIWVSGEYETKLSVKKLLFPEGIVIDTKTEHIELQISTQYLD